MAELPQHLFLVASPIPNKKIFVKGGKDILTFKGKDYFFPGGLGEQDETIMRAIMEFEYSHPGSSYAIVDKDTIEEIKGAVDVQYLGSLASISRKNAGKPVGKVGKPIAEVVRNAGEEAG